jgi:hypothetical protein
LLERNALDVDEMGIDAVRGGGLRLQDGHPEPVKYSRELIGVSTKL